MSFLTGGGSSSAKSKPTPAPPPPRAANNPVLDAISFTEYKRMRGWSGQSYARAVMGGGAPNPKKSYAGGLFSSAGV